MRYSEDMDLDLADLPVFALKDRVKKILEGPTLGMALRTRGLAVDSVSAPKQPETTQRWKIAMSQAGRDLPIHTKVEFSRRSTDDEAKTEPVDREVLAEYQLMPLLVPHYPLAAALRQKVRTMAHRREAQARDVFDLVVLFARARAGDDLLQPVRDDVPLALDRAMDISWEDFRSQVVSFLQPEHQGQYSTREAWEAIQSEVVDRLGAS